jgi:hypothetical protein
MKAVPLSEVCYIYPGLTTNLSRDYTTEAITFANKVFITGTITVSNYSKAATGNIILTAYQADGTTLFTKVFQNPAYSGNEGAGSTAGVYKKTYTLGLPIAAVGTKPVVKVSFANTLSSADYTVSATSASPATNLTPDGAAGVNVGVTILYFIDDPTALAAYLSANCAGGTAENPKPLKLPGSVTGAQVATIIAAVGNMSPHSYVSLDLSAVTGLVSGGFGGWLNDDSDTGRDYIKGLVLPASLTSIGEQAFAGCSSLTSVDLSRCTKLTSIGSAAFLGCNSLTSVNLPASLHSIGECAFSCPSLTSVTFGGGATIVSGFNGDLYMKYASGGAGTYTWDAGGSTWRKQP